MEPISKAGMNKFGKKVCMLHPMLKFLLCKMALSLPNTTYYIDPYDSYGSKMKEKVLKKPHWFIRCKDHTHDYTEIVKTSKRGQAIQIIMT